jgi:hypothetical protein
MTRTLASCIQTSIIFSNISLILLVIFVLRGISSSFNWRPTYRRSLRNLGHSTTLIGCSRRSVQIIWNIVSSYLIIGNNPANDIFGEPLCRIFLLLDIVQCLLGLRHLLLDIQAFASCFPLESVGSKMVCNSCSLNARVVAPGLLRRAILPINCQKKVGKRSYNLLTDNASRVCLVRWPSENRRDLLWHNTGVV